MLSDALRIREYIVRFRHRSPAYHIYYYDKMNPESFPPGRLVETMQLKNMVDQESQDCKKEAKKTIKRVQIRGITVYAALHFRLRASR